jgi:predicted alpha/beta hydrolase family esterase
MALAPLHRGVDLLAMWIEDRVARSPQAFRPGPAAPIDAFGPLPTAPAPPAAPAAWRFPAPAWGGPPGDAVTVRLLPARGPARGTAILVPPWKTRPPALLRGWTGLLSRLGLEVWLLVPPHHLGRAGPGERSGEAFVSNDLGRLRAALAETVREIRMLSAAAAARGPVGLVGLSLGALAAAHAATAPERHSFAALLAPPVDLARTFATTPIGSRYRRLAERAGAPLPPEPELRALLAPLSPAGRPPTAARILVAAGECDAIVPMDGPVSLARAWGVEPRIYPRGHLTLLFACRGLRREVARLASGRSDGGYGCALRYSSR